MAAAAVFVAWMWATLWPMTGAESRAHACREDPGQATSDLVILGAAVASLGAVGLFLTGGGTGGSAKDVTAALRTRLGHRAHRVHGPLRPPVLRRRPRRH
jgi:hypothetical protein